MPLAGWLINNKHSFLSVLEADGSGSGCPYGCVQVRALFQFAGCWLLVISSHVGKKANGLSGLLTISFPRVLPWWSNDLPRTSPPSTITLGIRFEYMNLAVGARIRSKTDQQSDMLSELAASTLLHHTNQGPKWDYKGRWLASLEGWS